MCGRYVSNARSGLVRHCLLTFQLTLILQAFVAIFVFPCSVPSATIRLHW
jgi:hypothetical protein